MSCHLSDRDGSVDPFIAGDADENVVGEKVSKDGSARGMLGVGGQLKKQLQAEDHVPGEVPGEVPGCIAAQPLQRRSDAGNEGVEFLAGQEAEQEATEVLEEEVGGA
jgi:hypothetical protein